MSRVHVDGSRAAVTFDRYDLDAYRLFLRAKTLPEKEIAYDWRTDSYTLTTAARFAPMLSGETAATAGTDVDLAPHLFDYQAFIVGQALEARRYAIWADTGLGKTAMLLEWARQVRDATGGRVLILAPTRELIAQHCDEWWRFYSRHALEERASGAIDPRALEVGAERNLVHDGPRGHMGSPLCEHPGCAREAVGPFDHLCYRHFVEEEGLERLSSRADLAAWCAEGEPAIGIATYALLAPGQLPELRRLAGIVADESSILKTGGGVIKWNLIHSAKGVEFKLSCTATPAPNDTMEYASQAAFLEKLRNEGEILWTYFSRDKRGSWSVKPHARQAFYRFMSSWSIYLRDPAAYGFADILSTLPPPVVTEHRIRITEEQRAAADGILVESGRGLFDERQGVRERAKLSQLAKGFLYEKTSGKAAAVSEPPSPRTSRMIRRVESLKPARVAELVQAEVAAGRPTIVWSVFDEESSILADLLADLAPATLHGGDTDTARAAALDDFRHGETDVLISKAQLIGYGLNLQHAKAMVFSGFDDSFERLYQAIRRAYRFGQTDIVHVHVPVIPELEGLMLDNLKRKQDAFDRDVQIQEANYRAALADLLPTTRKEAA